MTRWSGRVSSSADERTGAGGAAGFTLLELLIVMAVLGILAGIVVFSLQGVDSSATTAACQSDFATTSAAVSAYDAQMGAYPGGTGSATATDSDPGTAPGFTPGSAPNGVNAARAGGELLVPGSTSPNVGASDSGGPWLKESPAHQSGYGIWVANDGSGAVQALDGAGDVPTGATHTAEDCATAAAADDATEPGDESPESTTSTTAPTAPTSTTTTTTVPPTTTTTTVPPTTTTTTTAPPPTTTTTTAPRDQAPRITSGAATTFRYNVFGSFTVTASGTPLPTLKLSGSLPSGVSFNSTTGVLSGTTKKYGSYRLTFTASNGIQPNATQSFTLTVSF
jgi:prepilin-type N-terminal cleavage/methylation domain-containing protein